MSGPHDRWRKPCRSLRPIAGPDDVGTGPWRSRTGPHLGVSRAQVAVVRLTRWRLVSAPRNARRIGHDRSALRIGSEIRRARIAAASAYAPPPLGGLGPHASPDRARPARDVTVLQLALACAAVGLEPARRLLLRATRSATPGSFGSSSASRPAPARRPWHDEVPMPRPGRPPRARRRRLVRIRPSAFEAETHLSDVQALERRALLKQRDAGLDVLMLVVADTVTTGESSSESRVAPRVIPAR